jgi:hypothetical protein
MVRQSKQYTEKNTAIDEILNTLGVPKQGNNLKLRAMLVRVVDDNSERRYGGQPLDTVFFQQLLKDIKTAGLTKWEQFSPWLRKDPGYFGS